jgi:hypothetical protein
LGREELVRKELIEETEAMMSVGISEKATAAELELEVGMKKLTQAISCVPEGERNALAPINAALTSLGQSMEAEDHTAFVCSLVDLADAVIEVRKKAQPGGGPLAEIPVPPYDLWLPFKADASRPHEGVSQDLSDVVRPVRNKKVLIDVKALLTLLGCGLEPTDAAGPETPAR